jgi:hypothetical protein
MICNVKGTYRKITLSIRGENIMIPTQPNNNIWDELAKTEMPERGEWFQPDFDGEVWPRRTLIKASVQSGNLFLVECEIVMTNHAAHPVGGRFTWSQKLDSPKIALGAIKQFITACVGCDPKDKRKVEELNPYYSQLMNGGLADTEGKAGHNEMVKRVVHLQTRATKTREGKDFTLHIWSPSSGNVGPWVEITPPRPTIAQPVPTAVVAPPAFGSQSQQPQGAPQPPTKFPWQQ